MSQPGALNLSSNIDFIQHPILCQNTLAEFVCTGIELEVLQWTFDEEILAVYSFNGNGQPELSENTPPGVNVSLINYSFDDAQRVANFTVTLSVEVSVLNMSGAQQLSCVRGPSLLQTINLTYSLKSMLA